MKTFKRVIILLADGARPDVLNELVEKGELPNIKRLLIDKGSYLTGVTAFPSTTGPAYMPFLTGCLPATCNVPGIRWLDKIRHEKSFLHFNRHRSYVGLETYLMSSDMRRDIYTLFDLLKKSYNIFNSVNKGVSFIRNKTKISRIWYWYYAHLTDRWNFVDKCAMQKLRKIIKKNFDMIFTILPGVDEYSHVVHYKYKETIDAYKRIDEAVAVAFKELSKDGRDKDTLFWIVSDHGLTVTHSHFCVNTFLESKGIRTLFYPKIFKKDCVAANMMSGNSMTHLYFKHDQGWQYPMYKEDFDGKYPHLIQDLIAEDAIDVLALRSDPQTIQVITKRGRASIHLDGDILKYKVLDNDPFGYGPINETITSKDSLSVTKDSDYPDAIYQIAHLFTSHRTGDIILSAAKGYDLRDAYEVPEHKGSHGSLHKDHMLVPIICNANLNADYIRTVDIFPTTLELLGHPVPANIDGASAQ